MASMRFWSRTVAENVIRQSQMTISDVAFLFGAVIRDGQQRKDDDMTRLLVFTVVALGMGLTPVLAADTSSPTTPPTESNVPPDASKAATNPPSGSADTSGGATEQSSSPPSAGSTMGKMGEESSSPPNSHQLAAKWVHLPTIPLQIRQRQVLATRRVGSDAAPHYCHLERRDQMAGLSYWLEPAQTEPVKAA